MLIICLRERNDTDVDVSLKDAQLISGKMANKFSVFQDCCYIINILHKLPNKILHFISVAVS